MIHVRVKAELFGCSTQQQSSASLVRVDGTTARSEEIRDFKTTSISLNDVIDIKNGYSDTVLNAKDLL